MTNREVLIHDLSFHERETDLCLSIYINCPYIRSSDCKNEYKYGTNQFNEGCCECKADWLEKEWDNE